MPERARLKEPSPRVEVQMRASPLGSCYGFRSIHHGRQHHVHVLPFFMFVLFYYDYDVLADERMRTLPNSLPIKDEK